MAKKPANLLYGVDDKPSVRICLLLAVQHIFFLASGLIVVTIVMRDLGCAPELVRNVVSMSMIAGGLATMLQALKKGPVGSGYLCTEGTDPSFLSVSLLAGAAGGLPLVFGMTIVSGLIECFLAKIMHRLRVLLPPEVTGVVLTMVGLNIVPVMMLDFFSIDNQSSPINPVHVMVAVFTLAVMVGTNVWSKGKLRLYSVITGMFAGYIAAIGTGVLTQKDLMRIVDAPLFSLPDLSYVSYSFDFALLIPIIVVTLASTLKSVASITMCQKVNDSEWSRPDLVNIGKGTMADGLACVIGGALGALGKSLYASSVGLSVATGTTSRIVAFYTGGVYIALAFLPKLSSFFSIMPRPVMGAALVFMVSFMVISGVQILTSRMIDIRRTFVIAVSLMFGMSVDIFPQIYQNFPPSLKPLFSSSLAVTTVMAIVLNLIMRIGISRQEALELAPGENVSDKIFKFMENQGSAWGARKEVVYNAEAAMNEFMEASVHCDLQENKVLMKVSFDEFNLDVRISYRGSAMEFPEARPDKAELRTEPAAVARLAGFLVRRYADKLTQSQDGQTCIVDLHFNH